MLVVRGVAEDAFITLDSGKSRNMPDLLSIEGYKHTHTLAAAANNAYAYISGANVRYQTPRGPLNDFIKAHPYLAEATAIVANKSGKAVPHRGPMAAVLFLANERGILNAEVSEFVDGVTSGQGLFKGDARLTLRDWVVAQRMRERGNLRADAVFGATARAWNAYASGQSLKTIRSVDQRNIDTLPVFGFRRGDYADVPDLKARAADVAISNLAKGRKRSPLRFGESDILNP